MFVTVASYKGGVGKTTTAIHLAAYFQQLAPTLLIDGDPNRSVTTMAKRGKMPFAIADEKEGLYRVRDYEHIIVDTEARPGAADFEDLARGCDLLIIPTVPASMDRDVLILTLAAAQKLAPSKYRVLLTKVPPPPEPEGPALRRELVIDHIAVFTAEIPRLKAFEHAAAAGVPVNQLADQRARRAWRAYAIMGKEITNGRKQVLRIRRGDKASPQGSRSAATQRRPA
jgi:chromosome partitioning protein